MKNNLENYPFLFTFNTKQLINTTTIRERLSRKPHDLFSPHRTNFHMIYLFTEGHGKHLIDFNEFEVNEKHILFISQGQVHAFDPKETYDGRALVFTNDFFLRTERDQEYFQNSLLFNTIQQPYFDVTDHFEELKSIFIEVYNELNKPTDKYQGALLHNLLYRIFLLSERKFETQLDTRPTDLKAIQLVTRFKQLVEKNYKIQRHVKFYSEELAVSQRTLQLAASKVFGKTPKEWISDRTILEIKRMLVYDQFSVKEIAFLINYEDPTNLVKFFRDKTGMTTTEFKIRFQNCAF
ncbi:AraC-like DNA-binding protein [Chryseobacterium sp. 52]|uniref:helix-turn-helix domain-containing protein n=1 Tax=Chryseobacterium sp. 52 TaxID=2035213 RepID=UPI000C586620|nr:helix-turn-helix transcriptional regulator [Chryseobacterium sp. 52]PIF47518.1 AraC-like DNA-binding protein [Chryseobacterium sp. 52]